jgi:hypothetical protein
MMALLVYLSGNLLVLSYGAELLLQIFIGIAAYMGISRLFNMGELDTMIEILGMFLNKLRKDKGESI